VAVRTVGAPEPRTLYRSRLPKKPRTYDNPVAVVPPSRQRRTHQRAATTGSSSIGMSLEDEYRLASKRRAAELGANGSPWPMQRTPPPVAVWRAPTPAEVQAPLNYSGGDPDGRWKRYDADSRDAWRARSAKEMTRPRPCVDGSENDPVPKSAFDRTRRAIGLHIDLVAVSGLDLHVPSPAVKPLYY